VVGNIASVSNGSFRFIFGVICDNIGFRNTYNILVIINIVNSLAIDFVAQNRVIYAIWIFMMASSEGGNFTIFPVYVA
jgi:nitrate/nitrite transporter NarK